MQCVDVSERLLAAEPDGDPELDEHLAQCSRCAHLAHGLNRLDSVLTSALVVPPPTDLQHRLAALAAEAAESARTTQAQPWWRGLAHWSLPTWLTTRPQMVAAQGLAVVMLTLASWQILSLVNQVQPILGDVAYAMELVVSSPATAYLGGVQVDFQSLGIWSVVGLVGWLLSENNLLGRWLTSIRPRLP